MDDYKVQYKFEHIDCDNDVIKFEFSKDEATTWDEILEKFLKFLSAVYGYEISDQVQFNTIHDRIAAAEDHIAFKYEEDEDDNTPSNS
jgi:ribosome assembly protein YihI (activator of Der GTPase)